VQARLTPRFRIAQTKATDPARPTHHVEVLDRDDAGEPAVVLIEHRPASQDLLLADTAVLAHIGDHLRDRLAYGAFG
jgi:hypothetical protein